jgi:hypothetical protein
MFLRLATAAFVLAAIPLVFAPVAGAPDTTHTYTVSATSSKWIDTGLALNAREEVQLRASGDGTCHDPPDSDCPGGPAGSGLRCSDRGVPPGPAGNEVPFGAVAGRLVTTTGSKRFLVGRGKTVSGPGKLELVYNDCWPAGGGYSDNAGSFTVTATASRRVVAKVLRIKGDQAYVRHGTNGRLIPLKVGDEIQIGDTIVTGATSLVEIEFAISGRAVSAGGELLVTAERRVEKTGGPMRRPLRGGMWAEVHNLKGPLEIQTTGGVTTSLKG